MGSHVLTYQVPGYSAEIACGVARLTENGHELVEQGLTYDQAAARVAELNAEEDAS